MPNITLQTYPYVDGTTPTGEQVSKDLYDPSTANSSYETMNGGLDSVNADPAWTKIQQDQIQQQTFTDAGSVTGTANLDYFPPEWFTDESLALTPTDGLDPKLFQPIPGANETFYLPWDAWVIFTWGIVWGGEQWSGSKPSYLTLFIDDTYTLDNASQRMTTRSLFLDSNLGAYDHWSEVKNRHWNGHFTQFLSKGWHTAGLRLIADGETKVNSGGQTTVVQNPSDTRFTALPPAQGGTPLKDRPVNRQIRVYVRSFKHIAFRGVQ